MGEGLLSYDWVKSHKQMRQINNWKSNWTDLNLAYQHPLHYERSCFMDVLGSKFRSKGTIKSVRKCPIPSKAPRASDRVCIIGQIALDVASLKIGMPLQLPYFIKNNIRLAFIDDAIYKFSSQGLKVRFREQWLNSRVCRRFQWSINFMPWNCILCCIFSLFFAFDLCFYKLQTLFIFFKLRNGIGGVHASVTGLCMSLQKLDSVFDLRLFIFDGIKRQKSPTRFDIQIMRVVEIKPTFRRCCNDFLFMGRWCFASV